MTWGKLSATGIVAGLLMGFVSTDSVWAQGSPTRDLLNGRSPTRGVIPGRSPTAGLTGRPRSTPIFVTRPGNPGGGHGHGGHHHGHHGHHHHRIYGWPYYGYSGYYGSYGYPYGYPYYGYGYGYRALPPVYLNAGTLFGPQPIKQMLGVDHWNRRQVTPTREPVVIARREQAAPALPQRVAQRPVVVRNSNAQSRDRSRRYLEFGDVRFAAGKYHEALQRYKKAITAAPDTAEPYFRRGHAMAAMGMIDRAADAYRRGLAIDPQWPASAFRFDDIYGDEFSKADVHEKLAAAAEEQAHSPDPQFVLGILLYFDGEKERASAFFGNVVDMVGASDPAALFLPAEEAAEE